MPGKPNSTIKSLDAWLKTHKKKGEKIYKFLCITDEKNTISGKKLLALLKAVQATGLDYEFYTEVHDLEFYKKWRAAPENQAFFNDKGLQKSGGVRDISEFQNTAWWKSIRAKYVAFREYALEESKKPDGDKALYKTLEENLQFDIKEFNKHHPKRNPKDTEKHLIDVVATFLAAHLQKNENNTGYTNYVLYPAGLGKMVPHALQIAFKFDLEPNSFTHFLYKPKELVDKYILQEGETCEQSSPSPSSDDEEKSDRSVSDKSPTSSPPPSPPQRPVTTPSAKESSDGDNQLVVGDNEEKLVARRVSSENSRGSNSPQRQPEKAPVFASVTEDCNPMTLPPPVIQGAATGFNINTVVTDLAFRLMTAGNSGLALEVLFQLNRQQQLEEQQQSWQLNSQQQPRPVNPQQQQCSYEQQFHYDLCYNQQLLENQQQFPRLPLPRQQLAQSKASFFQQGIPQRKLPAVPVLSRFSDTKQNDSAPFASTFSTSSSVTGTVVTSTTGLHTPGVGMYPTVKQAPNLSHQQTVNQNPGSGGPRMGSMAGGTTLSA